VYAVGPDLGLGRFEVFVFTDFREDGFETFLRLLRQVRTRILSGTLFARSAESPIPPAFGTNAMWQ